jgi:hypothetical protein
MDLFRIVFFASTVCNALALASAPDGCVAGLGEIINKGIDFAL